MKKFSVMMMALALVMGMTQCKKEQPEQQLIDPEGEKMNITLTLANPDAKADVVPTDDIAYVNYKTGDEIWVAYKGKWLGRLKCTSVSSNTSLFNGDLNIYIDTITFTNHPTNPVSGGSYNPPAPLMFYFFGNKEPVAASTATDNTEFVIDLSDQSGALPVISYAPSEQDFSTTTADYTVKYNSLKNQCALVKFTMENIYDNDPMTAMSTANDLDQNSYAIYTTTKPITIYGMKNQVKVDLSATSTDPWAYLEAETPVNEMDGSFEWSVKGGTEGDGAIQLYSPSATEEVVRYAIVAPGDYNTTKGDLDVEFIPSSDPYGFYGTYRIAGDNGAVTIANNAFYQNAKLDLVWHSGAFSIDGTTVDNQFVTSQYAVFSRGNLQYASRNASADKGTWRFAKHQYDWVGGEVAKQGLFAGNVRQGNVVYDERIQDGTWSNNENIAIGYGGWIDLFGWGTGDNPTTTDVANDDYSNWHEWGEHSIINSGKPLDDSWWQTMRHQEWTNLLDNRNNAHNKIGVGRIDFGTSCGTQEGYINGLILIPDTWSGPAIKSIEYTVEGLTWTCHGSYSDNTYSESEWKDMEAYGAVFLPAAGYRNGTDFDGGYQDTQNRGVYWSFTQSTSAASWSMRFHAFNSTNVFAFTDNYPMSPDNGHAVRLVHKISNSSKFFNKKK